MINVNSMASVALRAKMKKKAETAKQDSGSGGFSAAHRKRVEQFVKAPQNAINAKLRSKLLRKSRTAKVCFGHRPIIPSASPPPWLSLFAGFSWPKTTNDVCGCVFQGTVAGISNVSEKHLKAMEEIDTWYSDRQLGEKKTRATLPILCAGRVGTRAPRVDVRLTMHVCFCAGRPRLSLHGRRRLVVRSMADFCPPAEDFKLRGGVLLPSGRAWLAGIRDEFQNRYCRDTRHGQLNPAAENCRTVAITSGFVLRTCYPATGSSSSDRSGISCQ